ncbi:hypothetical protein V2J09_017691 [Rumex salicifolius]
MDYAHKVFDQLPERDVVLWNTLIRGYSDVGPCHEALILYHKMHQDGVLPDCYTFPFVLRSCAVLAALVVGKQVHCNVIKCGFDSVGFVQTSLVSIYSQSGDILGMELVFEETSERNVVSWSALIAGYVQNGLSEQGMIVFREMLVNGTRPNSVTLVSVLPACAGLKLLALGRSIHSYGIKMGMDLQSSLVNALIALYGKCGNVVAARLLFDQMPMRDMISWNTMIASYEQNNASGDAIRLFWRMQSEKVNYNYITMVSVIAACKNAGDITTGRRLYEMVINKGLETNPSVQNALVDMYSKCGDIASAKGIFERLPQRNVVAWTSIIGGCASHGEADSALELYSHMKREGIRPNGSTFVVVLSACRHAGLVEEGKRHFESMVRDYSIVPQVEHCACVVDLLGRAGRLQEAYEFIQSMGVEPDVGIWGALLGACRVHGNVVLAELVAKRLFQLEPQTVTYYVVMSHIYAESGRWDDAQRLRSLMKERNLEKLSGRSVIHM